MERFEPKAYKLMAEVGYDFTTHIDFSNVKMLNERQRLSPMQKKLQKQGYPIPNSRVGIGYKSFQLILITGKRKVKVTNTCHIIVK